MIFPTLRDQGTSPILEPLVCPCPPLSLGGDPRSAAHRAPRRHPAPDHGHAADERHAASRDVILCVRRAPNVRTGGARDPAHGRLAGARLVGQGKGWRQVGGRAGPRWDPGMVAGLPRREGHGHL